VRWPEPAATTLETLEGQLRQLLGSNLSGMYVYGSLAFGCYNPARSDVDVLVVTRRRLSAETRRPLSGLLHSLPRLEISFLSHADLIPWRHPCPFDYHFSDDSEVHDRTNVDLAAEVANARARGVAVVGPPPAEAFPDVPEEDYLDTIVRDIRWARDRLDERPAYAVLNCCRGLAYSRERVIMSKAEGAEWGMRELPADFRPLAETALADYRDEPHDGFAAGEVLRFSLWVEASL
jgi:predicted nucleotidyltransferase